jgi:hypothetical protein
LKPPVRRSPLRVASRRGAGWALALAALAFAGGARAQVAGTLGVDSVNRYRGADTDDRGPVLRASAMGDTPWGAYGGVSALWRTRDAGFASADAMLGWSGRLATIGALDSLAPDWGWDAGIHRMHYAGGTRYDFTEAMLGLLAPGAALRAWYAPRYFGGHSRTLYTELDASRAFDEHWHAFAHLGWLHYGPAPAYQWRVPDRIDTLLGIGWTADAWELRLSRDGIVSGRAHDDADARRRRAAWILGASVAF